MVNAIPEGNLPLVNFACHLPNRKLHDRFAHVNGKQARSRFNLDLVVRSLSRRRCENKNNNNKISSSVRHRTVNNSDLQI